MRLPPGPGSRRRQRAARPRSAAARERRAPSTIGHDPPETSAVYSAVGPTLVMSLVVPFFWTAPVSLFDAALLSSLGILGGLGHYLIARALTYAPANVLAPFMYWQMVGAVAFGHVVSGVLPDALTWAGTAIIMSAGLWIAWRETRDRARQGPSGASPS